MNKLLLIPMYLFAVLIYGILTVMYLNNDYMTYRPVQVETIQLYGGMSSGKYSSLEFIVVYKTQDGILFDRYISGTVMATTKVGDTVTLRLRPMDIKQSTQQNILYFFMPVVAVCLYIMFIVIFGAGVIYRLRMK